MPENATDLHERFAAHVFKHEQERIVQRWRIRWRQFVSLFLINGIILFLSLFLSCMQCYGNELSTTIAVLCGGSTAHSNSYGTHGHELGQKLKRTGCDLLIGGFSSGLMKDVIDGYLSTSTTDEGNLKGIILKRYSKKEIPYRIEIREENCIWVNSIHDRLNYYRDNADIIIALPGGFGTAHEIVDCLVHMKRRDKKIILVNLEGWWDPMLSLFKQFITNNPLSENNISTMVVVDSIEDAISVFYRNTISAMTGR